MPQTATCRLCWKRFPATSRWCYIDQEEIWEGIKKYTFRPPGGEAYYRITYGELRCGTCFEKEEEKRLVARAIAESSAENLRHYTMGYAHKGMEEVTKKDQYHSDSFLPTKPGNAETSDTVKELQIESLKVDRDTILKMLNSFQHEPELFKSLTSDQTESFKRVLGELLHEWVENSADAPSLQIFQWIHVYLLELYFARLVHLQSQSVKESVYEILEPVFLSASISTEELSDMTCALFQVAVGDHVLATDEIDESISLGEGEALGILYLLLLERSSQESDVPLRSWIKVACTSLVNILVQDSVEDQSDYRSAISKLIYSGIWKVTDIVNIAQGIMEDSQSYYPTFAEDFKRGIKMLHTLKEEELDADAICRKLKSTASSEVLKRATEIAIQTQERIQRGEWRIYDVKGIVKHPFDLEGGDDDFLIIHLAYVCKAIHYTQRFWPRFSQVLSCAILLISEESRGSLVEIATGEGKSCIIAVLATMFSKSGKSVDIVTSSPVLAKRDVVYWSEFYSFCGLSVGHNIDLGNDGERCRCYKQNIVYGTVGSFASDILRQEFHRKYIRLGRGADTCAVIVDEVDFMMIDQGVQFTYLSDKCLGFRHIEPILALIWNAVNRYKPVMFENQMHFHDKPQPFYEILENLLVSDSEMTTLQILEMAEEKKLLEKGFSKQVEKEGTTGDVLHSLNSDKMLDIFKMAKGEIHKGLELYAIEDGSMRKILSPEGDSSEDECPVAVVLLDKGLCISIIKDENMLQAGISAIALEHMSVKKGQARIKVPKHLKEFVKKRIDVWVKSAFHCLTMKQDREYIIKDGKVSPVDFRSTGTVEINKKWGDGLQQFVELKHGLRLSQISLVTNFMSNLAFFKWYKGNLYGVSGTLGSKTDQCFLMEEFNVDLSHVPSHMESCVYEEPGKILPDESEWFSSVIKEVKHEVSRNRWRKKGRAALVICEDIRTAYMISEKLRKEVRGHVYLYTGDGSDRDKLPSRMLRHGQVIVATNLAGRGTDIQVTKAVNRVGGLFVLVTFLPLNTRVERQAFGRTGRKGLPGSVKVVINLASLPLVYQSSGASIDGLRVVRNDLQKEWQNLLWKGELKNCKSREFFFKRYCDLLKEACKDFSALDADEQNLAVTCLHEQWGMWLQMNSDEIGKSTEKLVKSFDTTLKSALQCILTQESQNIYHIIQFGNEYLTPSEGQKHQNVKRASRLYEKACKADKQWSSIALYNNAYCKIKMQGHNYMQLAENDLEKCLKKLKNYKLELMHIMTNAKLDECVKDDQEDTLENSLSVSIEIRQRVIDSFERNVQESVRKLRSLRESGESAVPEPKTIFALVDDDAHIESQKDQVREEFMDLWNHGLENVFSVNKKPKFCWSALAVFLLGVAQLALGVCLVAVSGGFLCTLGKAFIEEGISDMYEGIKGMIKGEFDWASWGVGKAMSLAISIGTLGVGSILSKGSKVLSAAKTEAKKAFKESVQQLKELPGALRQQFGTSVVENNVKQALKAGSKEVAEQGIIELANYGTDKLVDAMMDKVEEGVINLVEESVRESAMSGKISDEIDNIALLVLNGSSEGMKDPMIQRGIQKTFNDLSKHVTDGFRRDPEWVAHTQDFIFGVVNKLSKKAEHKDSKTFAIFKNTLKTSMLTLDGARAVKQTAELLKSFESRLSERVTDQCNKKGGKTEKQDDMPLAGNDGLLKLKIQIGKDIAKILSSTIRDIWQKNFVRNISSEMKRKFNQQLSEGTRKTLKTDKSFEHLEAGVTKFHAASMSVDVIASSDSSDRFVKKQIDELRSEDKPASVTDGRILSENLGRRIEIVQDNENGSPLIRIGKETEKETIKLVYEEPSEHNRYGHYNAVVNGKLVVVQNTGKDCLYHALAAAEGTSPADVPKRAAELKRKEAEELEANPERWNHLMERTIRARAISSKVMLVGAGIELESKDERQVFRYGEVTKCNGYEVDHQPPCKAVNDAVNYGATSSPLLGKLTELVYSEGQQLSNRDLLAVALPKKEHRYLLTTGGADECKVARDMIGEAIVKGDVEEMFKLTFLASSVPFCESVKGSKCKMPPGTWTEDKYDAQCLRLLDAWKSTLDGAMTNQNYNNIKAWIAAKQHRNPQDNTYQQLHDTCKHIVDIKELNKQMKDANKALMNKQAKGKIAAKLQAKMGNPPLKGKHLSLKYQHKPTLKQPGSKKQVKKTTKKSKKSKK